VSATDSEPRAESVVPPRDDVAIRSRLGVELPGGFRVRRFVGRGGMGTVFEASRRGDPRKYAVKFLHPELAGRPTAVARFRREAKILATLDNEHIVAVVDVGHADDAAPFIAMELLQGQSLRALLSQTAPLATPRAVELALQCCRGLTDAHARGIVHRDLKPENLFVARRDDGTDWVKLLDFGIAKLVDDERVTGGETQSGALLGTLSYMSPAQVRGERELDGRVDVYAIGCILYEMLTGQRAHDGARPHEVLYHVLHREPAPLAEVRPDLPRELVEVVERAMAKDVVARTPGIDALAVELEHVAAYRLVAHRDRPPVRAALQSGDATLTDPAASVGASLLASQSSGGGSAVADVVGAPPKSRSGWWWPVLLVCALGFGVWAGRHAGVGGAESPPQVADSPSARATEPAPARAPMASPLMAVEEAPAPSAEPARGVAPVMGSPSASLPTAKSPRDAAKPTRTPQPATAEAPTPAPARSASSPLQFERHNPYK